MLRIKAPLLLLGKASIKKKLFVADQPVLKPPSPYGKKRLCGLLKKIYFFFYIVHFIKPYRDQCICKLDLGKVL